MSVVEDTRPPEGEDEDVVAPDDYDGADDNEENETVVPPDDDDGA